MMSFPEFLDALYGGRIPYPWQTRFAREAASGALPEIVRVPTAAGKTTVLDALVWALATQAAEPVATRTLGPRIVWAIDRRMLVDEVSARAEQISQRLRNAAQDEPLAVVAERLRSLQGPGADGDPLVVTRWRGGIDPRPPANHPMQAEIITSTVGQIGSRLLFRGYGLGDKSLPLGAAMSACGTTICLDEAHLAEPFAESVAAVIKRRAADPIAQPLNLVRLSATPSRVGGRVLTLSEDDLEPLKTRLTAEKFARLIEAEGGKDQDQEAALMQALHDHLSDGAEVLACVVNTVGTARRLYDAARSGLSGVDAVLLIGPQRPFDREKMLDRPGGADSGAEVSGPSPREVLFSGAQPIRPLIVIATQTFEVGVDADVEVLVTQSASAVALTQRLGRLNRAGRFNRGWATIVRHEGFGLYAEDEPDAWEWLHSLPSGDDGAVDVSVVALGDNPPPEPRRVARAPELHDATIALLSQTLPRPNPFSEPDVDVFIKGVDVDAASDVTLCWRSDLRPDLDADDARTYRQTLLRFAPPMPEEQLSLSLASARKLIGGATKSAAQARATLAESDVEGAGLNDLAVAATAQETEFDGIPFFVLRGGELLDGQIGRREHDRIPLNSIRPGDLIVVPVEMGGVDEAGFAPRSERGSDVGARTARGQSGSLTIRLTSGALDEAYRQATPGGARTLRVERILREAARAEARLERARSSAGRVAAIDGLLRALEGHPSRQALDSVSQLELFRLTPLDDLELADTFDELDAFSSADDGDETYSAEDFGSAEFQTGSLLPGEAEALKPGWVLREVREKEDDLTNFSSRRDEVTISDHSRAVAERAAGYARAAGLSDVLVRTIELAGLVHDHGKADPRMQAFFRGGIAPPFAEPLAKSVFGTADRRTAAKARRISGWPERLRHELASAAIFLSAFEQHQILGLMDVPGGGIHLELASHVVIAHHGFGRPVPPVPKADGFTRSPATFTADINGICGVARGDGLEGWDAGASLRRFARLNAEFGHWGLAYLEAMLVLADRTVSAEGK